MWYNSRSRVNPNVNFGKRGIKEKLQENEREDAMYILMEVNLLTNYVSFVGNGVAHANNLDRFSIQNVRKPFRIALELNCGYADGTDLGLVMQL